MKGFGKFFQDKFGKIQEKITEEVSKINDSKYKLFLENIIEFATDVVNITAKVNEKVNAFQIKQATEKKDQPQVQFDVCISKRSFNRVE
jgi:hypothetical protein